MSENPIFDGCIQVFDEKRRDDFRRELTSLINRYSRENGSDTPDFVLARYLSGCLVVFDGAVNDRETWYGRKNQPLATEPKDDATHE